MKLRLPLVVVVALLACSGALAQSNDIVKMVPKNAWGFAIVNRLNQTDKEIQNLAVRFKIPNVPSLLKQAKTTLGITKGLNENGSLGVIVMPGPAPFGQPMPAPVFIVPVSNYKQFVTGMGGAVGGKLTTVNLAALAKTLVIGQRGKFAVVAEKSAKDALMRVLNTKNGGGKAQPLQKWLATNDGSAVVMPAAVRLFGDLAVKQLDQMIQLFGKGESPEEKIQVASFKAIQSIVRDMVKNIPMGAIGARLNANGNMHLSMRGLFAKGGAYAKACTDLKVPKGGVLAGLPNGPFLVAGGGALPRLTKNMLTDLVEFGLAVNPNSKEITPKQRKRMRQLFAKSFVIEAASYGLYPLNKKTLVEGNMLASIKVPDAAKYIKEYPKLTRQMTNLMKEIDPKSAQEISFRQVKLGKVKVIEVTTTMPKATAPEQQKMYEMMFGKDGKLTGSLAAVDKHTVLYATVPAEKFAKLVAQYKADPTALTNREEVKRILRAMPKNPQMAFVISVDRIMQTAQRVMKDIPGAPKLPAFPKTPLMGKAIQFSSTGVHAEFVIPIATAENIIKYGQRVYGMLAGGGVLLQE